MSRRIITRWNKAAERMVVYTAEEAVGQHFTLVVPADRRDEQANILERLGRGQSDRTLRNLPRVKEGTLLDVSLTISPVRDAAARFVALSGRRRWREYALRAVIESRLTKLRSANL